MLKKQLLPYIWGTTWLGEVVPLCTVKTYGKVKVILHLFITLLLNGGELLALHPGCLTHRERVPAVLLSRDWVCPRAGLDSLGKSK